MFAVAGSSVSRHGTEPSALLIPYSALPSQKSFINVRGVVADARMADSEYGRTSL